VPKGTTYIVGELPGSAAGGVDHDFEENGYVWMTGDALDFYTPDVVYGLQGTPHGGGDIMNSTLIDMDDELTTRTRRSKATSSSRSPATPCRSRRRSEPGGARPHAARAVAVTALGRRGRPGRVARDKPGRLH
jgi:hypothetical protein